MELDRALFQFDSEEAAKADPVISQFWTPIVPGEGGGWSNLITPDTSVYYSQALQPGWSFQLATASVDTTLAQHSNCRLAWNVANSVVIGGTNTGNDMAFMYVTPTVAGDYVPWNGQPPDPPEEPPAQ